MKAAAVLHAGRGRPQLAQALVHTGQHYDDAMSARFFADLALPAPDAALEVGSGTHAEQTARALVAFEPVLDRVQPDWVVVYGDVNSTLASALCAAKKGVPVAHVEAGVRSGDRAMPEELNRVLTDQLATLCLTPNREADAILAREGVPPSRIRCVGNVMMDTLTRLGGAAAALGVPERLGLAERGYAVATFHRPANVDDPEALGQLLAGLGAVARELPVVFPMHPRTRARVEALGPVCPTPGVRVMEPLGYLEMIGLVRSAAVVLTDSGGLQVEAASLGTPCVTVRPTTEWTETIRLGLNRLARRDGMAQAVRAALGAKPARGVRAEGWDGAAGGRVLDALLAPLPAAAPRA